MWVNSGEASSALYWPAFMWPTQSCRGQRSHACFKLEIKEEETRLETLPTSGEKARFEDVTRNFPIPFPPLLSMLQWTYSIHS